MPNEVSGHGKGRSIPKSDRGIGKRVSLIVRKMSGKLVQSCFGKEWELVNRLPPSRETRNYAHGGKGPFHISY